MRTTAIALLVCALIAALIAGCGGSSSPTGGSSGGGTNITVWEGYTSAEATEIKALAQQFNATHHGITVTVQSDGNNDYALQKVLAAIAGGNPPDIAYLYGSWAANIATNPNVVTINHLIAADPSFHWQDFWPAARLAATVNGKIVGVPALIDNLALVYNKRLFARAHLATPTANWTWSQFQNAAEKLTNPSAKQFGWAYVNDGSEDTVWRFWATLWQAGGSILTPNGRQAAFDSPAGVHALSFLQTLAHRNATYLDNGNGSYLGLFNSGHIGMLWTGPWDLSQIITSKVPYGVEILPAALNHQTISGPDNWVMFNNGKARSAASWTFLKWLMSPAIDLKWSIATGDLPMRRSVIAQPGYATFTKRYPGIDNWVKNLSNAVQARPTITAYPKISPIVGQAVQSVLLGRATPQQALSQAASQVNALLAAPGG